MKPVEPLRRSRILPLNESRPVIKFPDWCDTPEKRLEYRNSRLDWLVRNVYLSEKMMDAIKKEAVK